MKKINLIILIVITLISCEKNDDKTIISPLIPLQTGNTWTFIDSIFSSSGLKTDTSILKIGDFIEINNYKGYKVGTIENSFNICFLANNDDDGNSLVIGGYSDVDTLLTSSIEYKKNAIKGESWMFQDVSVTPIDGLFESREIKMTCINIDTMIQTPKGKFICKSYSHSPNSGDDTFITYISEGIGIIKSEHYEYKKLFSIKILIDYTLIK